MNEEDEKNFQSAKACHICGEEFDESNSGSSRVRDHNHYTGKPTGAAHLCCNRDKKRAKTCLVIYIHNLASYDQNFIVNALKENKVHEIRALPINFKKFRTLTVDKVTYLDSLAMMDGSLDKLVDSLKRGGHDFPIVQNSSPNTNDERLQLLIEGKGIFPYEWCTDFLKMENATNFPEHEDFYSSLKISNVSEEDYHFGKKCFEKFNCSNMVDYLIIYCMLDVLLLAECVMKFKQKIKEAFDLDITNYISLPQLSFDCMLKDTKCQIELMNDPEMLLMVESNIRGGLSYINTRYISVEDSDDSVVYVDANNLYSWAQLRKFRSPIIDG